MSSEKARQSEDGHHCGGRTAPEPLPEVDFGEFVPSDYEAWKEAAVAALKGTPFKKAMYTSTYEGITLDPLYMASDTQDLQCFCGSVACVWFWVVFLQVVLKL